MPAAVKPLTADEALVLKELCECQPGKGAMLLKQYQRAGKALIRKGLAWAINGGFGEVYIATDEGRIADGGAVASCPGSSQVKLDNSTIEQNSIVQSGGR